MASNRDVSSQVGFFKTLINRGRLVLRLLGDSRVPIYLKALPVGAALYVLSPLDFIPDIAIGLGQLDDLGVVLAGVEAFIALCPQNVVEEHRADIEGNPYYSSNNASGANRSETIDGEWKVK